VHSRCFLATKGEGGRKKLSERTRDLGEERYKTLNKKANVLLGKRRSMEDPTYGKPLRVWGSKKRKFVGSRDTGEGGIGCSQLTQSGQTYREKNAKKTLINPREKGEGKGKKNE